MTGQRLFGSRAAVCAGGGRKGQLASPLKAGRRIVQLGGWDILTPSAQRKPSRGVCHDLCLPLALSLHVDSCIQTCIKLPLCAQLQALPETLGRVFNKNKTEGIRNYFRGRATPTHHCCPSVPSWVHHPLPI